MMLKGANAHQVIDDVQERMKSIQKSLPEGITIEPYLNRSDLVGRAIGTVSTNLIEGALIVIFILVLLLGNLRAGLIVASVIPRPWPPYSVGIVMPSQPPSAMAR